MRLPVSYRRSPAMFPKSFIVMSLIAAVLLICMSQFGVFDFSSKSPALEAHKENDDLEQRPRDIISVLLSPTKKPGQYAKKWKKTWKSKAKSETPTADPNLETALEIDEEDKIDKKVRAADDDDVNAINGDNVGQDDVETIEDYGTTTKANGKIAFPDREEVSIEAPSGVVYKGSKIFTCREFEDYKNWPANMIVKNKCLCHPKSPPDPECFPKFGEDFSLAYEPDIKKRTPYNIVLISIDTCRRDVFPAMEGKWGRPITPFMNAKFRSANRFKNHMANAPWTLPSHAAMLTGLHPEAVGVLDADHWIKVAKLPHYLTDQYERHAYVQNLNLTPDELQNAVDLKVAMNKTKVKQVYQFGWSSGWDSYNLRAKVVSSSREFLTSRTDKSKPYFLFFHTNVMHDYNDQWAYFQEAEKLDQQMEYLMAAINFTDTIVVFTADHGEGIEKFRHRMGHGARLHNDLVHLPSAIWLPQELQEKYNPAKTAIKTPTSNMDIVPTILRLIGDEAAPEHFVGEFMFNQTMVNRPIYLSERKSLKWTVGESYKITQKTWGLKKYAEVARDLELRSVLIYPMKYVYFRVDYRIKEEIYNINDDYDELLELQEQDEMAMTVAWPANTIEFVIMDPSQTKNFKPSVELVNSTIARNLLDKVSPKISGMRLNGKTFSNDVNGVLSKSDSNWVVFIKTGVTIPHGWISAFMNQLANDKIFGGAGIHEGEAIGNWNDEFGHHKNLPDGATSPCEELTFGWFAVHQSLNGKCSYALKTQNNKFTITTSDSEACRLAVKDIFATLL